jgi:hypothetical protein
VGHCQYGGSGVWLGNEEWGCEGGGVQAVGIGCARDVACCTHTHTQQQQQQQQQQLAQAGVDAAVYCASRGCLPLKSP